MNVREAVLRESFDAAREEYLVNGMDGLRALVGGGPVPAERYLYAVVRAADGLLPEPRPWSYDELREAIAAEIFSYLPSFSIGGHERADGTRVEELDWGRVEQMRRQMTGEAG